MKSMSLLVLLILISTAATVAQDLASSAGPQSSSSRKDDEFHGFNAYSSISGLVLSSGSLIKLDSSVGYDFNRNFGIFAGAPLYFTNDFGGSARSGLILLSLLLPATASAEEFDPSHRQHGEGPQPRRGHSRLDQSLPQADR